MILKLWDNTEFEISEKEAIAINGMIDSGAEWIVLGVERIKVSAITKIIKGGLGRTIFDKKNILSDVRTATDEGMKAARIKLERKLGEKS